MSQYIIIEMENIANNNNNLIYTYSIMSTSISQDN